MRGTRSEFYQWFQLTGSAISSPEKLLLSGVEELRAARRFSHSWFYGSPSTYWWEDGDQGLERRRRGRHG